MPGISFSVKANLVDVSRRCMDGAEVVVRNGKISEIRPCGEVLNSFVMPGLIDSHVHVESSMLVPVLFASMVVRSGTVAVVSDPHEIANVMGVDGVRFMIENGRQSQLKFFFGAPSCVPATRFETSGASLDSHSVKELLAQPDVWFLSEMMNFPGVIQGDPQVMGKISAARQLGKPIDGHAPRLSGRDLRTYVNAGIQTDHECGSREEALEKISYGMKVLIREGSAARNFEALFPLVASHPHDVMLCTDDSHPDDLLEKGHMDKIIRMGLLRGLSIFDLLQACVFNPIDHYRLPVGRLRVGDPADFIRVGSLEHFDVVATYVDGVKVFDRDQDLVPTVTTPVVFNCFNAEPLSEEDLRVLSLGQSKVKVIEVVDGELYTRTHVWNPEKQSDYVESSPEEDILKLVVYNRYRKATPSIGFVKGIGLKKGAIASTVAHDSHNIIAVGVSDHELIHAINYLIDQKGGIVASNEDFVCSLPLPVAGLMTTDNGMWVSEKYKELDGLAREWGSSLQAPFMTLSFLSLLVIPELKLSDCGLFDVSQFKLTNLFLSSSYDE